VSDKSLLESEAKLLKLAVNLEKMGSNSTLNHTYKNLVVNLRNEYDEQIQTLVRKLNEVNAK